MNRSDQIGALALSLSKAQGQMKGAPKSSVNPFFKSHYSDLASVIETIRKPFSENGLSFVQLASTTEEGVEIETVLMHESGQWVSSTLVLPVSKQDAQGIGSAITYAKRYGLQAIVGVPSEDDDGNAAATSPPQRHAKTTMTPAVKAWIEKLATNPSLKALNDWLPEIAELEEAEKPTVKMLVTNYAHNLGWKIPKGATEFVAGGKS